MQGRNPVLGLLVAAVFLFSIFWTLVFTDSLLQPNQAAPQQGKEQSEQESSESGAGDARLANYTFWLTVFTGLLAGVSGIQGWLLIRADRAATKAAKINTETTNRSMDLREKQFALAADQHQLAMKQHGIQRLQFFAEHKPQIAIRTIGLKRPAPRQTIIQEAAPLDGELIVVNRGDGEAIILYAVYRFFVTATDLPMIPPLDDEAVAQIFPEVPHTMEGHVSHCAPISFAPLGPRVRSILVGEPDHLYVMGAVRFEDGRKMERWMGFCWQYWPPVRVGAEGHFGPISNPAYQYAD